MKTRRFLFVITLIGITTLACRFLLRSNPLTEVRSVAVNPPSGTGSFTLTVTYTFYLGEDRRNEEITCYYVTPVGDALPIGNVSPPIDDTEETILDGTQTFSLSASDPGVYTATCVSSTSKASAVFGVTDPLGQNQTEPAPTATLTPSSTVTAVPTSGPTTNGTGRFIFISTSLPHSDTCAVPADFSLTVESDGTANLNITTTFVDNKSSNDGGLTSYCVLRSYSETVSSVGRVNVAGGEKTVSFDKITNQFGYSVPCEGTFSYANGVLSGEMTCTLIQSIPSEWVYQYVFTVP